ncbi:EAL domain-containing protein [Oculatella sp. LEGE 06141]|uniref:EAL domain-containing protein n=1 Tax=Oculatella sp. LEGE 06141 TaxID=1828648 RepID=UPI00187EDE5F|nr:EAL domain-containing protein [Oculatella sp. LEGE 06141]MBE9180341.1 EAL domain-containing protein [Oculatella sp. LEGE 06141]
MIQFESVNPEPAGLDHSAKAFAVQPFEDITSLISHELRTPLTAILGSLGLLKMGQLGALSEEGQQLLSIAISNADRLTRLADAIDHESLLPMTILSSTEIEHFQLENDLYQALDCQEFQLVYQPMVSVESDRIIGFEALARWKHYYRGSIPPAVFIPLAEKTGIIHPLGMWILEQACQQLHRWQQQFPAHSPLTMSVNLSPLQLLQPDLVSQVRQILQDTNIAPNSLKLEITESALIQNYEMAIGVLSELKALGVRLYIDDFGTGYSSLSRLQDLPVDALKIDRSFVNGQKWDISKTIILLATKLGLEVIAEGVETAQELKALKALGCNQMQGYLFSKPIDSHAANAMLSQSGLSYSFNL